MKLKPGDLVHHDRISVNFWGMGLVMEVGPKEDNWVEVYWFKKKRRQLHPTERLIKVEAQSEV